MAENRNFLALRRIGYEKDGIRRIFVLLKRTNNPNL